MKMQTKSYWMWLLIVLIGASANAAEDDKAELKLKTEKVIVFKDGHCLVLKRGAAWTNAKGEIYTSQVPDAAVLGSFWATPKDGRMISMVAGWQEDESEESKTVACIQTLEVLLANKGKSCKLEVGDVKLDGVIHEVLAQETSSPLSESHRASFDSSFFRSARPNLAVLSSTSPPSTRVSRLSGTQFVLRARQGDILLNVSEVRKLTIDNMKTTIKRKVTRTQRHKQLRFRFEKPGQKQELLIAYFRPGVRWIPTYRIDLANNKKKKDKTAEITMQAEIINEAEDLIDTPIDIVVGVPNFRFRTITSPFTLEGVLRNALQQAAPQLMGQFRNDMSNSLYSQRSAEVRRNGARANGVANGAVNLPNELTASGGHDLFVYSLPSLQLRKGERAAVPIFTTTAPYRDVHTWDLHLKRNDIATAPSGSGIQSPLVLSKNQVWRQIELTNNTNVPWTTGAAMIMEGNQPLAQELLTYTSPKDACRVPVTVAVDVRGSFSDEEIGRELKSIHWNGYHYAKIKQRAKLSICNHKPEDIELEVSVRFGGKAVEASKDGDISLAPYSADDWQRYRGDPATNNSSTVRWKAKLKAGELFEPVVESYFYTRH